MSASEILRCCAQSNGSATELANQTQRRIGALIAASCAEYMLDLCGE